MIRDIRALAREVKHLHDPHDKLAVTCANTVQAINRFQFTTTNKVTANDLKRVYAIFIFLQEIVASHQELRCPECRVLVEIKIDELPPNVLLMRILEGKLPVGFNPYHKIFRLSGEPHRGSY